MGSIIKPKTPKVDTSALEKQQRAQAKILAEQKAAQEAEENRQRAIRRRGGLPQTVTTSALGVKRSTTATQPQRKTLLGE